MEWYKQVAFPAVLTSIVIVIIFFGYFTVLEPLNVAFSRVTIWSTVIAAFALIVGAGGAIMLHLRHISKKTPGQWPFSIVLIVCIVAMSVFGLYGGPSQPQYAWMFKWMYQNLGATMSALLGFQIVYVLYKSFRIKTVEMGIFTVTATIILMRNTPILETIFPGLTNIGTWVLMTPMMSAQRGALIALGIGAVAYSVRVLLTHERGHFGGER